MQIIECKLISLRDYLNLDAKLSLFKLQGFFRGLIEDVSLRQAVLVSALTDEGTLSPTQVGSRLLISFCPCT